MKEKNYISDSVESLISWLKLFNEEEIILAQIEKESSGIWRGRLIVELKEDS